MEVYIMVMDKIKEYASSCNIGIYAFNKEKILFSYYENRVQDGACTLKVFIMLDYVRQIQEGKIEGNEMVEVTEDNSATGAGTIRRDGNVHCRQAH